MIDSFEFRWKQWRQQTPPFNSYRFGSRSAPTYHIELRLDHVRTSVVTIVTGYWDGRGWDTRTQIVEELGNLNEIEHELASTPEEAKHIELVSWIRSTRGLLRSLYDEIRPSFDRFVTFPELTRDTSRGLLARVLLDLVEGRTTREEVAEWASHYVRMDYPPEVDGRVWSAVERMSGADSPTTDRDYLYTREDFEEWLRELTAE